MFLAAIMVLSVVASSAAFAGAAAAQAEAGVTVTDGPTPNPVEAGDSFDLTVEVTNTGDEDGTVTGLEFANVPEGVDPGDGPVSVTGLAPGESEEFDITVNVADGVEDGDYSFTANGQVTNSFTGSAEVSFTVGSSDQPDEQPDDTELPVSNYDDDAPDAEYDSYGDLEETTLWQGQEITVDVSDDTDADQVVLYERIDEENSQLRQQLSVDSDGTVTIDTEDETAGDYFLTGGEGLTTRNDAEAELTGVFSISEQSLTAVFDEDSVTDAGADAVDDEFEFESNRGNYPVTIHANGELDEDDLYDIFVAPNDDIQLYYSHEGDDGETEYDEIGIVSSTSTADPIVGISDSDEYEANFTGIDTGEYQFTFVGTDSTAEDTDSITVTEQDETVEFGQGVEQAPAGDIASFEVTFEDTTDTYVQIGGEDSDFVDVLYIDPDDESQPVEVDVNTRLLGTDAPLTAVYDFSNEDTFESAMHGGLSEGNQEGLVLYEDDGEEFTGDEAFEDYLDAMDIITTDDDEDRYDQLTRPLQATDYEIIAAGSNDVDAVFDADAGGEANDELGSMVLELSQPQIGDITTHTAPENAADDEDDVQALVDAATQREEIAIDDQLVVQVEATGLYGAIVAGASNDGVDADWDRLDDGVETQVLDTIVEQSIDQIDLTIEADSTTGNQEPLEVDLSASNGETYVVLDEDNGQFFVVVDTSEDSAFANGDAPDEDVEFTASLEYDADNGDDRFEFDDSQDPFSPDTEELDADNYPYLEQGEVISSSTDFTLSPRSILFDNTNVDQVVEAENVEDAEISGTTNVAPGSDATIRVSSDDASTSFRQGNSVNITEDGSVSTTFDMSGQEADDQFEINYRIEGSSVDSADGVVVEAGTLGDEAPEEDDGEADDGEADDGGAEDGGAEDGGAEDGGAEDGGAADDGNETDDGETGGNGDTSEQTPGFGAIVALVAVLGAALLASRRQN